MIEVVLVMGILAIIAAMVVPNFARELTRQRLPGSAGNMRSLLTMVRAHAAFDGKQYRIRFPLPDETEALGDDRQPIIEREDDPFRAPEVYVPVTEVWSVGDTFLNDVWCAEVRLGRPTVAALRAREDRSQIEEELKQAFEDFDPNYPPLIIEADGTSDWVTFVLTTAPRTTAIEDLAEYPVIEVIMEGSTGSAWLQRPLFEEEVDLFEEKRWPIVLRQDFLDPRVLTEDDVLELRDYPQPTRQGSADDIAAGADSAGGQGTP